jgi:hypothetical protein
LVGNHTSLEQPLSGPFVCRVIGCQPAIILGCPFAVTAALGDLAAQGQRIGRLRKVTVVFEKRFQRRVGAFRIAHRRVDVCQVEPGLSPGVTILDGEAVDRAL